MSKFDDKLNRMKAMMNYGLKTENKNQYKSVEYQREGADGKMYGIVREGTNYYIKVSEKTKYPLKEDFDYIGGFRNRKNFEYSSYANALKNFDMKMKSIKESKKDVKEVITESWNLDSKKGWTTEATEKMRDEINRQREIMTNAKNIFESKGKAYSTIVETNLFEQKIKDATEKVDKEYSDTQKNNIKGEKHKEGDATKVNGDPYIEDPKSEDMELIESEQVLGWNDNADYLDTSHGTEIGDGSPFNQNPNSKKEMENGVIDETAMHNTDNQNSPEVGTNSVGDGKPFEKKVNESSYCEEDDIEMSDEEEFDGEDEFGGEEYDYSEEDEFDSEDDDLGDTEYEYEMEDDGVEDDLASEVSEIKEMLSAIMDELDISLYDDEPLYDDNEEDIEMEDDMDLEDDEDFEDEEDFEVYESASYKRFAKMNEDKMDYFGKHPAYRKEPMTLPSNNHQEKDGYYDMNDESAENDEAFGQSIGSGAPFEIDPKSIENAIAESFKRIMKKKI